MCTPLPLCAQCGNHVFRWPCMPCFFKNLEELKKQSVMVPMPKLEDFLKETN